MDYVHNTNVWAQILTEQWEPLSLAHYCTHTHTHTLVCDCLWGGRNGLWMPGRVCVFRKGWCALLCSYHGKVALSRPHQNNTVCFVCVWAWHSFPLPQPKDLFMYGSRAPPRPRWSEQAITWTHTHTHRWTVIHKERVFPLFFLFLSSCTILFCNLDYTTASIGLHEKGQILYI